MTDEELLAAREANLRRVLDLLVSLQLTGSADNATIAVNKVEFARHCNYPKPCQCNQLLL